MPRAPRTPAAPPPVTDNAKRRPEHKTPPPLLASFRRHLAAEGKAEQTIAHYVGGARQFLEFIESEGLPDLPGIRREHVELWIEGLFRRYRPASVVNRYNALRMFTSWLVEEGEIRRDPMERIKRPAIPESPKDVVDEATMSRAFAHLEKLKRHRDLALLALLYDTGMRASEVAESRVENLDLDRGVLLIPRTKNREVRTVGLAPKTVRYLDRYLRQKRREPDWVFNGPKGRLTRSGVYWAVRGVFEELGHPAIVGPHDLRHTSATHAVGHMSEAAMMTLYGWSDSAMPRHYAKGGLLRAALEEHRRSSPMERLGR